jgi:hypothetical protein
MRPPIQIAALHHLSASPLHGAQRNCEHGVGLWRQIPDGDRLINSHACGTFCTFLWMVVALVSSATSLSRISGRHTSCRYTVVEKLIAHRLYEIVPRARSRRLWQSSFPDGGFDASTTSARGKRNRSLANPGARSSSKVKLQRLIIG